MEKLFKGAELHIWCEGNTTFLKVINNYGQEANDLVPGAEEMFILISDTDRKLTCDLTFKVV